MSYLIDVLVAGGKEAFHVKLRDVVRNQPSLSKGMISFSGAIAEVRMGVSISRNPWSSKKWRMT